MYKCIVVYIAVALFAAAGAASAAGFSSLEERMSQSEFHATGLDKLSPEELKALDEWLRAHQVAATAGVAASGHGKATHREAIESHIRGKFTGWYGGTIFHLENGQDWKQSEGGQVVCSRKENPKITIKPGLFDSWLAQIESCPDSVRVQPVE